MGKRGFPPKEISQSEFEGLCKILCTEEEIAFVYGCSPDTILSWVKRTYGKNETFQSIRDRFSSYGKISLRRYQFNLAKTNAAMAIFLGKQYLGQTDNVKQEVSIEDLSCLSDMLKIDTDEN